MHSTSLSIRKIIAALMLVVFSFSVTPTILLHNWIADHNDSVKKTGNNEHDQLSNAKYYCHCDNIVAESPFTGTDEFVLTVPEPLFFINPGVRIATVISFSPAYFPLRGPPAV